MQKCYVFVIPSYLNGYFTLKELKLDVISCCMEVG